MSGTRDLSSNRFPDPEQSSSALVASQLRDLADDMFEKLSAYLQGQIDGTISEYKLLEDMNNTISQRYEDMKQVTLGVSDKLVRIHEKYENLRPFLQQIDEIDESTRKLEEAANSLTSYVSQIVSASAGTA